MSRCSTIRLVGMVQKNKSLLVGEAYNKMANLYQSHRDFLSTDTYVSLFAKKLKKQSLVLDVGCGSGVPVDKELIRRGHLVTGLDISQKQIQLARKNCPTGNFMVRDMRELSKGEFLVDGLVSMYALFHIPREEHGSMLSIWASYLTPGGWALISMGDRDFEGYHDLCGERVWSSHFDPATNVNLMKKAGFEIEMNVIDRSGDERHQIVLAQKKE